MDNNNMERLNSKSSNTKSKLIENLSKHEERENYFWAWPMLNMYNRRMEAGIKDRRLFAFPADILT